jgi:F-type H+-transporting ATPase subunit b
MRRCLRAWIALMPALLVCLLLSAPATRAQTAEPAPQNSAGIMEQPPASMSQTIVRESREAAGEDNNDQFKKSSAVRFVSDVTGLSLESAYWLCMSLNFAAIAAIILWFSRKSLPGLFRNRTIFIQKAMEEARRASAEANERLSGIEKRLARLDDEILEMRAAAEKEAAAEEERIKAATAEDARKIAEAAGQEIAAAAKAARRELTAYAADLAVTLARKQIQVDTATDQGLVRHFADQLSNGNPDSGRGKQ